ncbi:MAG: hypothetical protein ABJL71_12270, partial [Cyclobacteriaceae bacterium]
MKLGKLTRLTMCGIVAYVGYSHPQEIIIKGLQRLEYRGYDSAGIGGFISSRMVINKTFGKVQDLIGLLESNNIELDPGPAIGHTRWATHGVPNDQNAHPHQSTDGSLIIVH